MLSFLISFIDIKTDMWLYNNNNNDNNNNIIIIISTLYRKVNERTTT